ncbi:ketopantoate reductase family protein [Brevibacterium yomogidense]|uniref:2-dehydropantoate 2-reductase n=1 Tax=Brevibacterium yomogidense TaxID=946573 RepID=A0A1X6WX09_9MICO|nr:2-dehydropantoate 2-reductase [Brevibacterium yomogidense]SLM89221.1 2-dehydropantoate 2-reductase [Brevibacterium yomogidense]
MKILVVGAGATGGAFGARLIQAGRDVTFLVRERRAEVLRAEGLRFRDPEGERQYRVNAITAVDGPYDLVVVAVKAPALPAIIEQIRPAVHAETVILPLLNGMRHIDQLADAYPGRTIGGIVKIVGTIDDSGAVVQKTPMSAMTIGALDGRELPASVQSVFDVPGVTLSVVDDVLTRMWEKWAFIASAGVVTCLFRGVVGDIIAAGGEQLVLRAIAETESVAAAAGHPVGEESHAQGVELLTAAGSPFTSSLYRDLQHGDPQEAEHILGDLSARAASYGVPTPLLDAAVLQLRTHDRARARQAQSSGQ